MCAIITHDQTKGYPIMIDVQTANAIRAKSTLEVEDALLHAISRLVHLGTADDMEAAVMLQDIWAQQGCEHLDTGVPATGRLVDAISVIVCG
jgi:hypothetical protein